MTGKPWTSVSQQVEILASRGLSDAHVFKRYLAQVGYYRLSGYSYPLRQFLPEYQARSAEPTTISCMKNSKPEVKPMYELLWRWYPAKSRQRHAFHQSKSQIKRGMNSGQFTTSYPEEKNKLYDFNIMSDDLKTAHERNNHAVAETCGIAPILAWGCVGYWKKPES